MNNCRCLKNNIQQQTADVGTENGLLGTSRCSNPNLYRAPCSFRPVHSQTVLCPVPPCGLSMMTLACCCRDPTRSERSGPAETAGAAQGGRQSTVLFPARGVPPRAEAPLGPGGSQAEQERRDRSPQPSSLSRSWWKRLRGVLKGRNSLVIRCYREATRLREVMAVAEWADYIVQSGKTSPPALPANLVAKDPRLQKRHGPN